MSEDRSQGEQEQEQTQTPQQEPERPSLPLPETPQEPSPQQPAQPAQPEPEPRTDWRDRRIGEQQQRLRERNARIAELESQLSQYQAPQPSGQAQPGQQYGQPSYAQQGDIQRQINEAAAQMAAAQEFTRRCNEVAEGGRRAYNNFDQRVQRLTGLVDANDTAQVSQYNSFLTACMETGQASRLIYELGGDLDEASRIMALNPVKMAVELTKLSTRAGTEASMAPRPLSPVASAATANRTVIAPDDPEGADTISTEEWMRRREEQIANRRQRTS